MCVVSMLFSFLVGDKMEEGVTAAVPAAACGQSCARPRGAYRAPGPAPSIEIKSPETFPSTQVRLSGIAITLMLFMRLQSWAEAARWETHDAEGPPCENERLPGRLRTRTGPAVRTGAPRAQGRKDSPLCEVRRGPRHIRPGKSRRPTGRGPSRACWTCLQ